VVCSTTAHRHDTAGNVGLSLLVKLTPTSDHVS
jgi:hypothetical protein